MSSSWTSAALALSLVAACYDDPEIAVVATRADNEIELTMRVCQSGFAEDPSRCSMATSNFPFRDGEPSRNIDVYVDDAYDSVRLSLTASGPGTDSGRCIDMSIVRGTTLDRRIALGGPDLDGVLTIAWTCIGDGEHCDEDLVGPPVAGPPCQ